MRLNRLLEIRRIVRFLGGGESVADWHTQRDLGLTRSHGKAASVAAAGLARSGRLSTIMRLGVITRTRRALPPAVPNPNLRAKRFLPVKLTSRQQTLLDRLIILGQWLGEGRLPMRATEVYGFGSFFRGKPKPRDIDLVLRSSQEETVDFQLFSKLLHTATYGGYSQTFATPQAALLHVFDQHHAGIFPGLIDVAPQRRLFGEWIDGYTWTMLFDNTVYRHVELRSAREIARRLMKRHLPNLNVILWLGPDEPIKQCGLNAGFAELVWSPEKPDVRANVERILADDHRRPAILAELGNFDPQVFRQEALCNLLKRAIELLLQEPRSCTRSNSADEWFRVWKKCHFGDDIPMFDQAMIVAVAGASFGKAALEDAIPTDFTAPSYDQVPLEELCNLVEEKRIRIKALWHRLEGYPEIIWALAHYKSRCDEMDVHVNGYVWDFLRVTCNRTKLKRIAHMLPEFGMSAPEGNAAADRRLRRQRSEFEPADQQPSKQPGEP
jgi:hypothetical protein